MEYNSQNWLNVANEFLDKWNMPNCLGGIDEKHVRIKCPPNAGSLYFNHKVRCICSFFKFRNIIVLIVITAIP